MVDILLSTYNGELFLEEQLLSILNNSYKNIRILIRDDGSSDSTKNIINKFVVSNPDKVLLIEDNKGNIGSTKSFEKLMHYVKSDYFMFCDQDDYWCSSKIEISLNNLIALEIKYGENTPCVVFTDLYVVDNKLNKISDSFFKLVGLNPNVVNDLYKAMAMSVVPGCTMMMNRAVLNYIFPIPKTVIHDFWVVVITIKYGKVTYLNIPTIKYRQHSNNSIGLALSGKKNIYNKLKKITQWLQVYYDFFSALPFKVNYAKFIYWKLYYIFMRL